MSAISPQLKIISAPTVTLVSAPVFHPHPTYALPPHWCVAENIIAMAGKVCYDSYGLDGNTVERHVGNLVASGHHSVLEHVHVGVFIEGISRGCSHEIVRHRMFNYSQRSTRYTAEDDAAIVLDPYFADIQARVAEDRAGVPEVERQLLIDFLMGCRGSMGAYKRLVDRLTDLNPLHLSGRDLRKWVRGKARQVLPHALETRMVMTGNTRAWRHFLLMRTSRHAEAEIRRLASAIFDVVGPIAPAAFEDLTKVTTEGFLELLEARHG